MSDIGTSWIKFEKERRVKYVRLFDFDDLDNNEFIVSRQVIFHGREDIIGLSDLSFELIFLISSFDGVLTISILALRNSISCNLKKRSGISGASSRNKCIMTQEIGARGI
jgi:hypothetical protein